MISCSLALKADRLCTAPCHALRHLRKARPLRCALQRCRSLSTLCDSAVAHLQAVQAAGVHSAVRQRGSLHRSTSFMVRRHSAASKPRIFTSRNSWRLHQHRALKSAAVYSHLLLLHFMPPGSKHSSGLLVLRCAPQLFSLQQHCLQCLTQRC